MAGVSLAVYSATSQVCKAHWLKIKVRLKWVMCQMKPNTFENVPEV
jgi:hypothetical protein